MQDCRIRYWPSGRIHTARPIAGTKGNTIQCLVLCCFMTFRSLCRLIEFDPDQSPEISLFITCCLVIRIEFPQQFGGTGCHGLLITVTYEAEALHPHGFVEVV